MSPHAPIAVTNSPAPTEFTSPPHPTVLPDQPSSGEFAITLDLKSILYGDYAAATVLISFCVLLGRVTILQLVLMTIIEVKCLTLKPSGSCNIDSRPCHDEKLF